jgi:hypothetical protein
MGRNKHLIAIRDRTGEPAIIEELMKGYQRPEDLAGAGVIIEQFRRKAPARGTRREQFP